MPRGSGAEHTIHSHIGEIKRRDEAVVIEFELPSGESKTLRFESYVTRVRAANPLPLYVGFGIATPDDAARVAACADGAVVGSALIRTIDQATDASEAVTSAREFLSRMNNALNPEKG